MRIRVFTREEMYKQGVIEVESNNPELGISHSQLYYIEDNEDFKHVKTGADYNNLTESGKFRYRDEAWILFFGDEIDLIEGCEFEAKYNEREPWIYIGLQNSTIQVPNLPGVVFEVIE